MNLEVGGGRKLFSTIKMGGYNFFDGVLVNFGQSVLINTYTMLKKN